MPLDVGTNKTTAVTKPTDFPSMLRQKLHTSIQQVEKHNINTMARADERCPKCGAEEVRYTTLQLRSADEGSTVLYYCDCGHTYVKTSLWRATFSDLRNFLLTLQSSWNQDN